MGHTYGKDEMMSASQRGRMFKLVKDLGLGEDTRHTLIHCATNGRSTSSKDLRAFEANGLINELEKLLPRDGDNPLFLPRRKVFAIAHELGWEKKDGTVDRERIQAFIDKRGVVKKTFLSMNAKELAQFITQLENVSKKQG